MERGMASYFLDHLWHPQDKKFTSVSTTPWQRAAGIWGKLISWSLSVKGERGGQIPAWSWSTESWEFIMEVPVLEPKMRGVPAILGVSHKESTEARRRETLTAMCETRQYCSVEQFPLYSVSSQTPGRKRERGGRPPETSSLPLGW